MRKHEARAIVGNATQLDLIGMHLALEIHPWLNTPEQWERLEACYTLFGVPPEARVRK